MICMLCSVDGSLHTYALQAVSAVWFGTHLWIASCPCWFNLSKHALICRLQIHHRKKVGWQFWKGTRWINKELNEMRSRQEGRRGTNSSGAAAAVWGQTWGWVGRYSLVAPVSFFQGNAKTERTLESSSIGCLCWFLWQCTMSILEMVWAASIATIEFFFLLQGHFLNTCKSFFLSSLLHISK